MQPNHNTDIACKWLNGENELLVKFGWEKDEEEEEAEEDLYRFIGFCETLGEKQLTEVLTKITTSGFVETLKTNLKIDGCFPRLYFKQIDPPYEENYKKIVAQYNLEPFIVTNIQLKYEIKRKGGVKGKAVFLSFIKLNEFYIVNLVGNKFAKDLV